MKTPSKSVAERDDRDADQADLLRPDADRELEAAAGALRDLHERDLEDLLGAMVDLRLRVGGLDVGDGVADAHAARLRAAGDRDVGDLARRVQREVRDALQRRAELRRARVRPAELTPRADLPHTAGVAQVRV